MLFDHTKLFRILQSHDGQGKALQGDCFALLHFPVQHCNNSLVCLFVFQVTSVSTSKTGKHGSAKCNFTAVDIFTGKKYEDIYPSTAAAHVPIVVRKEYSLLDISADGFVSLMDEDGAMREDIKLPEYPENFAREIQNDFDAGKNLVVHVLSAMGHDQIIEKKEEAEKEPKKN